MIHGEAVLEIREKVLKNFGNMDWFFVKHPSLNYICPFVWIMKGGNLCKIKEILDREVFK
jgi:hypothetical protein